MYLAWLETSKAYSNPLSFPKQFTVGFSRRKKRAGCDIVWPRSWSLRVRLVSALCPLWPRLETLPTICLPLVSALAALPNLVHHICFGFSSKYWPSCVGGPPCLISTLCRLWPRLQALYFLYCHLYPSYIHSLFFYAFIIRSLSNFGRVYILILVGPLLALFPFFGCATLVVLWLLLLTLIEVFITIPFPNIYLNIFKW